MLSVSKIRSSFSFSPAGRWFEYIIMSVIAILISWSVYTINYKIGAIIVAGCIGFLVIALCFYHLEIGAYGLMALSFLAAFIDRMTTTDLHTATILLTFSFLLFGILMFKNIYRRDFKYISWHALLFIDIITISYAVTQLFNPSMASRLGWLSFMRAILGSLAILFLFLYIFKDLKSVRFFFKFIIGALFITGLYGCIQQKIGFTPFEHRWLYSDWQRVALLSLPGQGIRKFSFFSDPANFGTLMASAGAGVIALTSGPFKKRYKIILVVFLPFIILGMSYSGTRTGNLMLVAGIALYILMTIYRRRTVIVASVSLLALLFILYAPIYGNVTINRFRSAFTPTHDASYDLRLMRRRNMQPFMHSHPFGNGLNTTMGAGKKYNPHNFLAGFPPDGLYFQIALEQGWVGLALNCIFFLSIVLFSTYYFYKCKNPEIRTYYLAMTVILFTLMLGAYTQFSIVSIPQNVVFTAFIACIIKLHTFDNPELAKKINKIHFHETEHGGLSQ